MASEAPHVPEVLQARGPRGPRLPPRRLAALAAVWVALAGGALLAADALDSPVGEGARDAAQPAAPGPVTPAPADPAAPGAPGEPASPGPANLPPFAMVLDRPLPAGVSGLPPAEQAERLRQDAMASGSPERLVELGSVLQFMGDLESAEFSYRSARERDPANVAAQVGLAVLDGGSGPDGLARAAERLAAIAADHPRDQLVVFNQAWVEIYRARGGPARRLLERTQALGPATRLGRTAAALVAALASGALGAGP